MCDSLNVIVCKYFCKWNVSTNGKEKGERRREGGEEGSSNGRKDRQDQVRKQLQALMKRLKFQPELGSGVVDLDVAPIGELVNEPQKTRLEIPQSPLVRSDIRNPNRLSAERRTDNAMPK